MAQNLAVTIKNSSTAVPVSSAHHSFQCQPSFGGLTGFITAPLQRPLNSSMIAALSRVVLTSVTTSVVDPGQEPADEAGGGVERAFQQEVAAVDQVHLGVRQILPERSRAIRPKDRVVLTPYRQQGDL
jgi:hypothetical protein